MKDCVLFENNLFCFLSTEQNIVMNINYAVMLHRRFTEVTFRTKKKKKSFGYYNNCVKTRIE